MVGGFYWPAATAADPKRNPNTVRDGHHCCCTFAEMYVGFSMGVFLLFPNKDKYVSAVTLGGLCHGKSK